MHKYIQNCIPKTFNSLFTQVSAIHERTTRWAYLVKNFTYQDIEQSNYKKVLNIRGSNIWNAIPNEIKNLSFNKFKIKNDLLISYY